jgi:hypothetical protein
MNEKLMMNCAKNEHCVVVDDVKIVCEIVKM